MPLPRLRPPLRPPPLRRFYSVSASPSPPTSSSPSAASASASAAAPATSTSEPLPSIAPKPTPDLKSIRERAATHTQNCIDRNLASIRLVPSEILRLHDELTALQRSLREDRQRANQLRDEIAKAAPPATKLELQSAAKALKDSLAAGIAQESLLQDRIRALALSLPNCTHPATPVGETPRTLEYLNAHLKPSDEEGEKKRAEPNHVEIGTKLGILNFAAAADVSGWGWYYLLDEAVLLEQALVNYALSLARSHGWTLAAPPSIVYSHIASACGFRPRDQNGEQQVYTLEQPADAARKHKPKHALAGTAEIPLAGLAVNKLFRWNELPSKVAGVGRSYRAEAGARGAESKGLYRVHEFTKVELFAWTHPEDDAGERVFNEMLRLQKDFVSSLGLYARVLEMPTTDLGAPAARKIDIEAYMPGRAHDPWGEVSSLSLCTDYQSRRLNTRVEARDGQKSEFAWTLNGTAVAVPRIVVALLENGYDEKRGVVVVPEVLRKWMGGVEFIERMGVN